MNVYEVKIVDEDHLTWETLWIEAVDFENLTSFLPDIFEDKEYDSEFLQVGDISLVGTVDYISQEAIEDIEEI